jgi:hypothetical protein
VTVIQALAREPYCNRNLPPLKSVPLSIRTRGNQTLFQTLLDIACSNLFQLSSIRMETSKSFAQQTTVAHYTRPGPPAPKIDSTHYNQLSKYFIQQPPSAPASPEPRNMPVFQHGIRKQSPASHWARPGHPAPKPDSNDDKQVSKYFTQQPPAAPVTPKPRQMQVSKPIHQQSPVASAILKFDEFGSLYLHEPYGR